MDSAKKLNWFGWKPTKLRRLSSKRPLTKIELYRIEREIIRIDTIFDEGYLKDEPLRHDQLISRLSKLIRYVKKSIEFTKKHRARKSK